MNKEDTKKWCEYYEKGIKPTRVKTRTIVYSERAIGKELIFNLDGYTVTLKPFEKNKLVYDHSRNYSPAFFCEVIAEYRVHQGGNMFDVPNALDKIMPWLEINYELSTSYKYWEEYEGKWISCNASTLSGKILIMSPDVDKPNIQEILNRCDSIYEKNNKTAKKLRSIMKNLQEGIKLKLISRKLSFLSFYSVIE